MDIIFTLLVFLFDYDAPISLVSVIPETVNEDEKFEHRMLFNDANGRAEVIFIQLPSWLDFDYKTLTLEGTPGNRDVGNHIIEFELYDYYSSSIKYKYELEVKNTNDPPRFDTVRRISTVTNEKFRFIIEYSDDDGDSVSVENIKLPEWLEFDEENNILNGIPTMDDLGKHDVSIDLNDGNTMVNYNVEITVEEPNSAPTFTNSPKSQTDEDILYKFIPVTADKDRDKMKIEVLDLPNWLSYNSSSNTIQGLPKNRDVGSHSITISVTDNINPPTVKSFDIDVLNVNDSPTINNPPNENDIYIQDGEYFEYKFEVIDEDKNDKIDLELFEGPSWLSFNENGHFIYGTAVFDTKGKKEKVRVKVIDEAGAMDESVFWIEVGVSAEAANKLDWEAVQYLDYIDSGEKSYYKIDDLKILLDEMLSYGMEVDMKKKFNVFGTKVATCYVVEPNDVTITEQKFEVERCIIIKFRESSITIDFRNDYKISKYKGDYIFVSK